MKPTRTFLIFVLAVLLMAGSEFKTASAQQIGLEIGNIAPEIRLPSIKGDTIALSSLRGKLVLIDFWGTWCSPCVEEQPELARLYGKYKNATFSKGKGFEIYGVSLDSKKTTWENGITSLHINWIQVSDLKFWRSPVAKAYNIQALPFNLLIDGKGVILAKGLHGARLERELAIYLKK